MKVFRPGEISIFYFRKCLEGYRALYLYGPSGEEAVILPGMLPTEAEIDELIRTYTDGQYQMFLEETAKKIG